MNEKIDSKKAPEPIGAYPHARRIGNLLFLSGVGPRMRGSKDIPGVVLAPDGSVETYDIAAQCDSCFENIKSVLEAAGSKFENIVDVLVFLTDMRRDFKIYNERYAAWFAGEGKPNPARTTIEIPRLPQGGNAPIAIELKVIATVD
ncbi:MAG: RidA family protein [Planctomycetota bacterium]